MIQHRKSIEVAKDSFSPTSVILPAQLTPVDLKTPKYMQNPSAFRAAKKESPLDEDTSFFCKIKENPFADAFGDPLCKLNLKETSEFVQAFPMASKSCIEGRNLLVTSAQRRREGVASAGQRRLLDTPSTPGRPVFSFSGGNLGRKSIPSKWDDAEKWLISTSCHGSPAHVTKVSDQPMVPKQSEAFYQKGDGFPEKFKVLEEKLQRSMTTGFHDLSLESNSGIHGFSSEVFLKDKFTDKVEPIFPCFQYTEPSKESFLFSNSFSEAMKDASSEVLAVAEVHCRDVGTEMTPFGSSTTSTCHTPIKVSSPARHNTPADRSGLLVPPKPSIDISELKGCHFAKLELGAQFDSVVSHWSSKEEEEEDVSKSLRHFEMEGGRKSIAESRASAWEDEEKTKSCIRYQREEAKIQAWVNLQNAKAEAQSRKLEVKIQKMRSNLEEKLTKRMANVHRKAEEWRATAQLQHSQQIQRAQEQAQKMKSQYPSCFYENTKCGCLPCNNHN